VTTLKINALFNLNGEIWRSKNRENS